MPKVTDAYLEARKEEILDAAIACFTRKGFHQTTMDDICRQAGLSPGAVYRYFNSKNEIIDAAVRENPDADPTSWPEFARWVEEEAVRFDDFAKVMKTFNDIGLERFLHGSEALETNMKIRVRSWSESLQNPEVKEEVLARWKHRLDLFEQTVRRAQELGQVNPELNPAVVGRIMLAIGEGFTLMWTIDPEFGALARDFNDVELSLFTGEFFRGESGGAD